MCVSAGFWLVACDHTHVQSPGDKEDNEIMIGQSPSHNSQKASGLGVCACVCVCMCVYGCVCVVAGGWVSGWLWDGAGCGVVWCGGWYVR